MQEIADVKLHDDLRKRVCQFEPADPKRVTMYVCGVTVYDLCHIGHARAYVAFDTIRRYLEYRGFGVYYIQNFTDVDDKIIAKAASENTSVDVISERYIKEYFKDMDALNIKRADVYPRATEHIGDMVEMIRTLVDKGYAYEEDGNVFFSVEKFEDYGKLSGRNVADELPVQEPAPGKQSPADFALWKKAQPGDPGWDSPWGTGRPGWHIECSAMSLKLAGGTLDIHGGGYDLTFPHHDNEIAQSEAATGAPFAKYWIHNGFVQMEKEKMSKSLGNVINIRDILSRHNPAALRLLLLGAQYRQPIHYSEDRIHETEKALDRIQTLLATIERLTSRSEAPASGAMEVSNLNKEIDEAKTEFLRAMDEDFNTPMAIAQIFKLVRTGNTAAASYDADPDAAVPADLLESLVLVKDVVIELSGVLGLDLTVRPGTSDAAGSEIDALMDILISARAKARELKQWELADYIRDALTDAGFQLEDRADGTLWKRKT